MCSFASSLRRIRQEKALLQREVAERAGITQAMVSWCEHGRRDPSRETVIALARALGVPRARLLGMPPKGGK